MTATTCPPVIDLSLPRKSPLVSSRLFSPPLNKTWTIGKYCRPMYLPYLLSVIPTFRARCSISIKFVFSWFFSWKSSVAGRFLKLCPSGTFLLLWWFSLSSGLEFPYFLERILILIGFFTFFVYFPVCDPLWPCLLYFLIAKCFLLIFFLLWVLNAEGEVSDLCLIFIFESWSNWEACAALCNVGGWGVPK